MTRKILIENKTFFFILAGFVLFFGFVIFFGSKRIYDRESGWRHDVVASQLSLAESMVDSFFSNLIHHLVFVRELAGIKGFVEGNFESATYRKEVEDIFGSLLEVTGAINRISLVDAKGNERLYRTESEEAPNKSKWQSPPVWPTFDGQSIQINFLTFEMIRRDHWSLPATMISVPLLDARNTGRGTLILYSSLKKILALLPRNVFMEISPGKLAFLEADHRVIVKDSPYVFDQREGLLEVSNVETVHYATVELGLGKTMVMGIVHRHIGLKNALQELVFASLILLFGFFAFISGFTYLNLARVNERNKAQKALIASLIEMTDWRDPLTGSHLYRTRNYSVEAARQLKRNPKYSGVITPKFLENLYDAAPLHDIGKMGIKDNILLKTGKLNDIEFEEMKRHVAIGKKMLQDIIDRFRIKPHFLVMARNIAAHHHEKFNGKGYPKGLKKEQISLEARIFSIADVYDALRSKRSYKEEIPHDEAIDIILAERGRHFDPDVVDAFLQCEHTFLKISEKKPTV
jgi:HD-GYP domain-containing protein (c-di-GMP phosphodiesterase class II)